MARRRTALASAVRAGAPLVLAHHDRRGAIACERTVGERRPSAESARARAAACRCAGCARSRRRTDSTPRLSPSSSWGTFRASPAAMEWTEISFQDDATTQTASAPAAQGGPRVLAAAVAVTTRRGSSGDSGSTCGCSFDAGARRRGRCAASLPRPPAAADACAASPPRRVRVRPAVTLRRRLLP